MKKFLAFLFVLMALPASPLLAVESDVFPELVYWSAVRSADLEKMESFLERGFDPNRVDGKGLTPLMYAVRNANPDMIGVLMRFRAKVDVLDRDGNSALIRACLYNNSEVVNALLEAGADINLQSRQGMTPLMKAIESGHRQVVELLLEKGSDLDVQDYTGRDALMWGEASRNPSVRKLIKKAFSQH